ncbi:hypothetical protein PM082_011220 [Marasmius tenuissimus]|nr:hypothetical protein PM082_011220 [Marasmius tenuissimus]
MPRTHSLRREKVDGMLALAKASAEDVSSAKQGIVYEGAIEKVQAYSSAAATSVVQQHMHDCHVKIWSNLIKLEYLQVQKREDWELVYADADALEPDTDTDTDADTEVKTEVETDSDSDSHEHTGGN